MSTPIKNKKSALKWAATSGDSRALSLASKLKSYDGRSAEAKQAVQSMEDLRREIDGGARVAAGKAAPKKGKTNKKKTNTKASTATVKRGTGGARVREGYNQKAKSGEGLCMCGCGEEVTRSFLQGHDARLKGKVRLVALEKLDKNVIPKHAYAWIRGHYLFTKEEKIAATGAEK